MCVYTRTHTAHMWMLVYVCVCMCALTHTHAHTHMCVCVVCATVHVCMHVWHPHVIRKNMIINLYTQYVILENIITSCSVKELWLRQEMILLMNILDQIAFGKGFLLLLGIILSNLIIIVGGWVLFLVITVQLNLLIAQISDTYTNVQWCSQWHS